MDNEIQWLKKKINALILAHENGEITEDTFEIELKKLLLEVQVLKQKFS